MLIVLQAIYGLAEGFYLPASTGLIPATISPGRLQQANALLGLARNATRIVGPAIGGAIVAAGSPGSALLIDAVSFGLGALLLVPLRLPARDRDSGGEVLLHRPAPGLGRVPPPDLDLDDDRLLRDRQLRVRVLLGARPDRREARPRRRAGVGRPDRSLQRRALVGGLLALRIRPKKPLAASCLAAWVFLLQPLGMGLGLPLWTLIVFSVLCGCGLAIHIALWFTVFQQNVPEESLSRVSSYDSFGSFVPAPARGGARRPGRGGDRRPGDAPRRRVRDRDHAGDRLRAAERACNPRPRGASPTVPEPQPST